MWYKHPIVPYLSGCYSSYRFSTAGSINIAYSLTETAYCIKDSNEMANHFQVCHDMNYLMKEIAHGLRSC